MSDAFYKTVRALGKHAFVVSGRPVILGLEHVPRSGGCLIVSNHTSAYDVALLIANIPRPLDFVSIVEVFRKPLLGWFYGNMNAFPLDRHKPDAPTLRTIIRRLELGRAVAMFPEGGFRRGDASVIRTQRLRPGVGRIVGIAKVPVIPAVIINSVVYSRPISWLPLRRTRYALALGPPIAPDLPPEEVEAAIVQAFMSLYEQAAAQLPEGCRNL